MHEQTAPLSGLAAIAAELGTSIEPGKPLEGLFFAVRRVNSAAMKVSGFVNRFHGNSPVNCANVADGAGGDDDRATFYNLDLDSLFDAINRLETHVDALEAIG